MSKRNKRTRAVATRSSRAGAFRENPISASKLRNRPSRHAQFAEFMRTFIKENVRMTLFFIGAASILQPFIPWTNDNTDAMWFIVIGSVALGLAVPRRLWR